MCMMTAGTFGFYRKLNASKKEHTPMRDGLTFNLFCKILCRSARPPKVQVWGRHLAWLPVAIFAMVVQLSAIGAAYAQPIATSDFTRICWNGQEEGAASCTGQLVPNYSNYRVQNSTTDWACTRDNRTGMVWSLQVRGLQENDGSQPWPQERVSGPLTGHGSATRCGLASNWRAPNFKELLTTVDFNKSPQIDISYFPGKIGMDFSEELKAIQGTTDNTYENDSRIAPRIISFHHGLMDDASLGFSLSSVIPYRPVWSKNLDTSIELKGDLQVTQGPGSFFRAGLYDQIIIFSGYIFSQGHADFFNFVNYRGFHDWRPPTIQELALSSVSGTSSTEILSKSLDGLHGRGGFYYMEAGRLLRKTSPMPPPTSYFPLVRGTSPLSKVFPVNNSTVLVTTIDGIGGKTTCSPSGEVAQGTPITCAAQPSEGFELNWGASRRDAEKKHVEASCSPAMKRFSPHLQRSYNSSSYPNLIEKDQTFNFAAIKDCAIKFEAFTQIRSLVLTEVFPSASGSLSCIGSGQDGWVKLGESGTCQATANPGYALSSVSGCAGTSTGADTFATGTVTQSCTVTAQFRKTQSIALNPPVVPPFRAGESFQLNAIATSGEPLSIDAEPPDVCSVSGSMVTMLTRGVCRLTLRQAGTDEFADAEPLVFWIEFGDQPQISEPGKAVPVPTLAHWAIILMGLFATALTGWYLRRQAFH